MKQAKTAVLISGRGSNLHALLNACRNPDYPARVELVISSRPDAPGLEYARAENIPHHVISPESFESRIAFETALHRTLENADTQYVCLAGFMRILSEKFVNAWAGRLMNIHPSLLPSFKGLDVHRRMIRAGVKIAGCTVHFVTPDMDSGPVIGQAAVPVLPSDTHSILADRILKQEHRLYPACVAMVVSGTILPDGTTAGDIPGDTDHGYSTLMNPPGTVL